MINNSNTLETQLIETRKRWVAAKTKGDTFMMRLWEKVGLSLKERIQERIGKPLEATNTEIENIFGGKLQE